MLNILKVVLLFGVSKLNVCIIISSTGGGDDALLNNSIMLKFLTTKRLWRADKYKGYTYHFEVFPRICISKYILSTGKRIYLIDISWLLWNIQMS